MPLIVLGQELKDHLQFLITVDKDGLFHGLSGTDLRGSDGSTKVWDTDSLLHLAVVEDFARTSVEFLRKGANVKVYQAAASAYARR